MLNIWDRADDSFTGQICDLIYSSIHERYDPTKVFVFRSKTACPYPNYELLRLEFMPHVIKTPPDKDDITLSARAVSYVLYAEKSNKSPLP